MSAKGSTTLEFEWGNYLFYTFDEAFLGYCDEDFREPYEEALRIVQASP